MPCNPDQMLKRAIRPSLARRLAEAADGFRHKHEKYFFVAKFEPEADGRNHLIAGPFKTPAEVPEELCTEITAGHRGWFGPFQGEQTPSTALLIHEMDISTMRPGETDVSQVRSVPARRFDCLFWSRSALEKFAVPYYARMYGGEYVNKLLKEFESDSFQMVAHLPGTEYEELSAAPRVPGDKDDGQPLPPGIAAFIRLDTLREEPIVTALLPDGSLRML